MTDQRTQHLLKILEIEREARKAQTKSMLGYHIVTRTRELIPYNQAALISYNVKQKPIIEAISDVAVPDQNGPFCLWLKEVAQYLVDNEQAPTIQEVEPENLPQDLKSQWSDWAPKHVLWVPVLLPNGAMIAALWLTRDTPWLQEEFILLERLADCYAHAWAALSSQPKLFKAFNQKHLIVAAVVILLLGFIPVRQSALAPAEIIPQDPLVISAPLEGVVKDILVKPYQEVTEGEALVRFDETVLRNQVAIAQKSLAVTKAELQTTRQSAFHDLESQSKISLLEAQVGLREAELSYAQSLLDRSIIYAPSDGVAVFRDVNDWVGRPTQTGEKIMLLAEPEKTQLKIKLPVSDAISLDVGATVRLFLDVDPLTSYHAQLVRTAYETQLSANGQDLNFELMANFDEPENTPRIGLRGTAKVYGDHTILGLYVFRKPLASLRKWLGW